MRYDPLDLSKIPMPDAVEVLDADAALNIWFTEFITQAARYDVSYDVQGLRNDPLGWAFRVAVDRGDVLLRQRVNDGVRAVLLPTAEKSDLDNVCADLKIVRRELVPADPLTGAPAVMESDDDLRERRALAPEALTTAGSYGAYYFHCKEAHPDVRHVGVYGPEYPFVDPGKVRLVVLAKSGTGRPGITVLQAIAAKLRAWEAPDIPGYIKPTPTQLNDDKLRPDTDCVIVEAANIINFAVDGILYVRRGPDPDAVRVEAQKRIVAYCEKQRSVGGKITLDSLTAVGRMIEKDGSSAVSKFELTEPQADLDPGPLAALYLASMHRLKVVVVDD